MPANQPGRRRRLNGDGSVYKRQDGYWVGAFYARTTSGASKRVVVYGRTLEEARDKLGKAQHQARVGVPVPTSHGDSARTLTTGSRTSSSAPGARPPKRSTR
jgi:hypothetical protein